MSVLLMAIITLTVQAQTKKVYDEEINQLEQIDKAVAEAATTSFIST